VVDRISMKSESVYLVLTYVAAFCWRHRTYIRTDCIRYAASGSRIEHGILL